MGTGIDSVDRLYLITGGAGSIGGALTRELLSTDRHCQVRVLSRNDSTQHEFVQTIPLEHRSRLRMFLGDVRDINAVSRYMRDVTHVYHCAAVKHVPAANYSSEECADVNIRGTNNVLHCAQAEGRLQDRPVHMVLLSTDKAVDPSNVMGATKSVAEKTVLFATWASHVIRRVVRFGNVWDSRGSVLPTFVAALRNKRPITITDPDATRYVISIDDAVLALRHATHGSIDEREQPFILIPRMCATTVKDILDFAVKYTGITPVDVRHIGLIPGEKMHESLLSQHEVSFTHDKWSSPKQPFFGQFYVRVTEKKSNFSCVDARSLLSSSEATKQDLDALSLYYTIK